MTTSEPRLVTADHVRGAFDSADIGPITFASPIYRSGLGWAVVVETPPGVDTAAVIGKRESLARGLGVTPERVVIDPDPHGSGSRTEMWVLDAAPESAVTR